MAHPDLQITGGRGGGVGGHSHSEPEIRGRGSLKTNFFRPLGPQFGLKIRGGHPSPGSVTASCSVTHLLAYTQQLELFRDGPGCSSSSLFKNTVNTSGINNLMLPVI